MTEKPYYYDRALDKIKNRETGDDYWFLCDIADLLNNHDKRIKELEKDLNDALNRIEERSIDVQLLKEENGNLKKENELKGDFRNFINEDIVRIKKENEQLKREVKRLKCINKQLEERLDKDIVLNMDCGDVE